MLAVIPLPLILLLSIGGGMAVNRIFSRVTGGDIEGKVQKALARLAQQEQFEAVSEIDFKARQEERSQATRQEYLRNVQSEGASQDLTPAGEFADSYGLAEDVASKVGMSPRDLKKATQPQDLMSSVARMRDVAYLEKN